MIIHVLLTLFIFQKAQSDSFKNNCFSTKADYAVSNSKPTAELFRVTPSECLNYCISNSPRVGDGCSSVVYHREFSTCQLYGHDGNFEGARVVPAEGNDYFLRNSFIGICQDVIVPKRGYKQTPKMYAYPNRKQNVHAIPMSELINLQEVTEPEESVSTTTPYSFKTDSRIRVQLPPEIEEEIEEEEIIPEDAIITEFLNPTRNTGCRKAEKVGYFVLFGYQMVKAIKPAKLKGVDQSSCVMYCSQNIDSQGNKRNCTSVNYDPVNEECKLYANINPIEHTSSLIENKNTIFADKFCVKYCSAESPFIVYPQKQVHKKIVQSYPGMNSLVACVAACIDHSKCKTITYKKGLCILHSASINSDAALLVDGSESTMVVENGCQLTASAVPSMISNQYSTPEPRSETDWEEWSNCQFGVNGKRVRVRQRECDDCENLQIEKC